MEAKSQNVQIKMEHFNVSDSRTGHRWDRGFKHQQVINWCSFGNLHLRRTLC